MSNYIDSIQLSGTVYTIQGTGGGGSPTVELTQAEYDALVSAGTVSANTYYIITDAQAGDLTQYWTSAQTNSAINAAVSGKVDTSTFDTYSGNVETALSGKQDTLSAGTNITIVDNVISATGGGGTVESAITSGSTNAVESKALWDELRIVNGESETTLTFEHGYSTNYPNGCTKLNVEVVGSSGTFIFFYNSDNQKLGNININFWNSNIDVDNSFDGASYEISGTTVIITYPTVTNVTKIMVGLTDDDIYVYKAVVPSATPLKDQVVANTTALASKADTATTYTKTEVDTALSGYVTTNTEQTISGRKVFTYTASSGKAIEFKQTNDSAKVGFSIKNSASTNNEVASFEFRPNTFTIDGVQHPLMYFGHYRNNNTANAGVPQTVIGFRQYDQKNAAAYHYLMPLPEKAKTPFSLTTSFKDYYAPMGFKNGSTMITADNTGVADFSSVLGGLKLVKLSQSDYNALTTKDDNTVYFIGDSTNGYTMKIGSANVN